ncbi:MAG: hypothetical protein KF898_04065 [Parachlamydiales bacterium]|nr:hypothetical protein [Verrucomicrobiota bacterium]MBX3718806.1 hypothetical protein [Candidatus Acheromyda pituitae]
MNEKFSIEMCSDLDYEGMVVDVSYDMETIASINYDKGIDNIEIEVYPISGKLKFPLDDFFLVLEKSKQLAVKCAKEDKFKNDENL